MAQFLLTKSGLLLLVTSSKLNTILASPTYQLSLVTTDPFTFDWDAVKADLDYAAGTGLDPQTLDTLILTGPWVDETAQEAYEKFVAVTFSNGTADPITVTGIAIVQESGTAMIGAAPFDDPITLDVGDSLVMGIPIGVASSHQVLDIEDLIAP